MDIKNSEGRYIKIAVGVPVSHADDIREVLNMFSAGKQGNYDCCSFSVKGIGRFRPLKGANPHIGKAGKIEEVEEERIQTIALEKDMKKIIEAIKKAHPYEEPAIDVWSLLYP